MGRILPTTATCLVLISSSLGQSPSPLPLAGSKGPSPTGRSGELHQPRLVVPPITQAPSIAPPKAPAPAAPVAASEPVVLPAAKPFDPGALRVKREGASWQLWAGTHLLKDFGRSEVEAFEALQVMRDLRVNARGTVGGVFEFFLADGQAPSAVTRHKLVIPFRADKLSVAQVSGNWCLRDDQKVLYSFGPSRADAEAALAVCRTYRFNQLGYVGHPTPTLKYLMHDRYAPEPPSLPPATLPTSARMQAEELALRPLSLPGEGQIGMTRQIDYRRLDLRRERGEWSLMADRTRLASFGPSEREGRAVTQALQQFRCTEICRVGSTGFGFFLSNGRAPQGTLVGMGSRPIRREALNVMQVNGAWAVCEGARPLISFGDKADEARHALAALKHFQFDSVCSVGATQMGGVTLFVKSR